MVAHSATLGKTLVYAANQMGALSAYNADTGVRQWVLQLAASIQSSPAIVNNVIYFGANDHNLYAVNASTGAVMCQLRDARQHLLVARPSRTPTAMAWWSTSARTA